MEEQLLVANSLTLESRNSFVAFILFDQIYFNGLRCARKRANFDETGMPVNGKKGWIWIAATKRCAFVQIAMSRGRRCARNLFSKIQRCSDTVDGWKSYRYFKILQRCWAHPLREVEILSLRCKGKGREEAEYLLSSLRRLFHETKEELKEEPPPTQKLHDRQLRKLRYILSRMYVDVMKFVSKLKSASRDLFVFTLCLRKFDFWIIKEQQNNEYVLHELLVTSVST
ncbi:MAG: IS66 family transposase [Nitrososphaerales archaeon]